jgi:hypothetical protein
MTQAWRAVCGLIVAAFEGTEGGADRRITLTATRDARPYVRVAVDLPSADRFDQTHAFAATVLLAVGRLATTYGGRFSEVAPLTRAAWVEFPIRTVNYFAVKK